MRVWNRLLILVQFLISVDAVHVLHWCICYTQFNFFGACMCVEQFSSLRVLQRLKRLALCGITVTQWDHMAQDAGKCDNSWCVYVVVICFFICIYMFFGLLGCSFLCDWLSILVWMSILVWQHRQLWHCSGLCLCVSLCVCCKWYMERENCGLIVAVPGTQVCFNFMYTTNKQKTKNKKKQKIEVGFHCSHLHWCHMPLVTVSHGKDFGWESGWPRLAVLQCWWNRFSPTHIPTIAH